MHEMNPFWLLIISGIIALMPIMIGLATSYVKVSVVLTMVKNAIGIQQLPGGMVIMALSMGLTAFIMGPVLEQSFEAGKNTDLRITDSPPQMKHFETLRPVLDPWKNFLKAHAGVREVRVLEELKRDADKSAGAKPVQTPEKTPESSEVEKPLSLRVLLPAFVLTELKEAFAMGFVLLLPFLVVDLVVANILVGLGMYMVSPVMIALPLKLILFVMADGWLLLTKSLISSYAITGG